MKWQVLSIVAFLVAFFFVFTVNDSSVILPIPTSSKTTRVPMGAQNFNLTSSEPGKKFNLTEFYPDQSFVGRYNIKIECLLYLGDHSPACSVVCRNLWNSSDPTHEMSTSESFHSTYTYCYSQPTVDDLDFSIQLELETETEITSSNPVEGWILLSVVDYGVTDRPEDFTMPTPVDTSATTTETTITTETRTTTEAITTAKTETTGDIGTTEETGTIESDSKQQVSFTSSFFCLLSLVVLFLWKKTVDNK